MKKVFPNFTHRHYHRYKKVNRSKAWTISTQRNNTLICTFAQYYKRDVVHDIHFISVDDRWVSWHDFFWICFFFSTLHHHCAAHTCTINWQSALNTYTYMYTYRFLYNVKTPHQSRNSTKIMRRNLEKVVTHRWRVHRVLKYSPMCFSEKIRDNTKLRHVTRISISMNNNIISIYLYIYMYVKKESCRV